MQQRNYQLKSPSLRKGLSSTNFILEVPKSNRFITELKNRVPVLARTWNPTLGVQGGWIIDNEFEEEVRQIIRAFYGDIL